MALLSPGAFADRRKRADLPGGGGIMVPSPFEPVLPDDYRWRDTGGLVAYRNHRSMMSGTSECDGMLAAARAEAHPDLQSFVMAARAMLTTRWSVADETEGRWYGKEDTRLPVERRTGPDGEELAGELLVHIVGFFGVYDKPGRFLAIDHAKGVRVAVWIFDSHGGERGARKIIGKVADSYA